jgi:predicted  nucleic acid-binding Zn-ribbon protein
MATMTIETTEETIESSTPIVTPDVPKKKRRARKVVLASTFQAQMKEEISKQKERLVYLKKEVDWLNGKIKERAAEKSQVEQSIHQLENTLRILKESAVKVS